MKHFLTTIVVFFTFALIAFPMFADDNNSYKVEGKTVTLVKESTSSSNDILTDYVYKDSKDIEYPIYLHKYTRGEKAGQYTVFVYKTSKKTGEQYKYYLRNGEQLAQQILEEINHKQ